MRLQLLCSSLQSRRSLRLPFGGDPLLLKLNNLNVCFSVRLAQSGTDLPIMSGRLDTIIRVQRGEEGGQRSAVASSIGMNCFCCSRIVGQPEVIQYAAVSGDQFPDCS